MIEIRKYGKEQFKLGVDVTTVFGRMCCPLLARVSQKRFFAITSGKEKPVYLSGYVSKSTTTVYGVEWVNMDGDSIFAM